MVSAVVMMLARRPFLLDVRNLTIGRELPVVTGHAPAREIRKAEETDEAHHPEFLLLLRRETLQTRKPPRPDITSVANMSNSCT
jgi:hypothetical protein